MPSSTLRETPTPLRWSSRLDLLECYVVRHSPRLAIHLHRMSWSGTVNPHALRQFCGRELAALNTHGRVGDGEKVPGEDLLQGVKGPGEPFSTRVRPVPVSELVDVLIPRNMHNQQRGCRKNARVTDHEWPGGLREASRGPLSSTKGKRTLSISEIPARVRLRQTSFNSGSFLCISDGEDQQSQEISWRRPVNTYFLFIVRFKNSCINDPIRSTSSSNAKWPVSRRWSSALGISLFKSSAPSTVKIPSFFPHVISVGG
jgi:hypothetical protein